MKKKILLILVGIVLSSLVGTGGLLYTRIWDPMWNPFRPSPETVIIRMAERMEGLKTSHLDIDLEIETKNKEEFKISLTSHLDSDTTDPENPKGVGDFEIVFELEGMQFSFGAEIVALDKDFYLKPTTIPALPFLAPFFEMMGIDLNQLKGQWIRFETEAEKEEEKEMLEELKLLLKDKKLYSVKKELTDEKIGEKKVYHYLVALNKEEIKKVVPEILEIIEKYGLEKEKIPEVELREFFKEFDEFLGRISEIEAEIWIGKKDYLLYRLKGEKEVDLSKFNEKGKVIVRMEMNFSKFDEPVKIEKPKDSKTLEEIFKLPEFPLLPFDELTPERESIF